MSVEIIEPRPDFEREKRFGRPLVLPPEGTKRQPYTRVTTFVGAAEDMFNVQRWEKRMVALGLAARPDLLLSVSAHRDDKGELNRVVDQAKEAAAASAAATTGTALHSLTELLDTGRDLPVLPGDVTRSLDAYAQATAELECLAVETQLVNDPFRTAGTADRLVRYRGENFIADIKTGSVELGINKIAGQLALYARSRPYDVTTDERGAPHGASTAWGLIVHLPASDPGTCRLIWVDLIAGWEWVKTCASIRQLRARKYRDMTTTFTPGSTPEHPGQPAPKHPSQLTLTERVAQAPDPDAVRALWRENRDEWTPELTELAGRRVKELEAAS